MVVAVFDGKPDWLEFSIQEKEEGSDINVSSLDVSKVHAFGFLSLSGDEQLFPLDGQHRLAGIQEALKDPKTNDTILPDDEVTVILVAHEPSNKGRIRSRRLFTVLNKRAVSVKKHETIALDEDDVMAITTRHLVEQYPPLSRKGLVSFRANANIPSDNHHEYTTIVTIYDMLFDLFLAISERRPEKLKFSRPDGEWLAVYMACAKHFFSQMMTVFPSIRNCLEDENPSHVISKYRRRNGGHILFRPVGQRMFAQLVSEATKSMRIAKIEGSFERKPVSTAVAESSIKKALSDAFRRYSQIPTNLCERPYVNLVWDPNTQKMAVGRAGILRDLMLMNYGLLRSQSQNKLESRLQKSVGEKFTLSDFLW
jgi:DNA sulfur modification protein DndB